MSKQPVSDGFPYKFGYLPDLPDSRDYTKQTPKISALLPKSKAIPSSVDLRAFCPPIYDQGQIGSCTANAAAALCILLPSFCRAKRGAVLLCKTAVAKCTW